MVDEEWAKALKKEAHRVVDEINSLNEMLRTKMYQINRVRREIEMLNELLIHNGEKPVEIPGP